VVVTQSLCHVCSVDLAMVERLAAQMDRPPRIISLNPGSIEDVIADCRWAGAPGRGGGGQEARW
jgi:Zn-finger nucleic acid-binding protein